MRWIARLGWIALLTSNFACCTPRLMKPDLQPQKCVQTDPCDSATGQDTFYITVDAANKSVDHECVELDPRETELVWKDMPGARLTALRVVFKPTVGGPRPPREPECTGFFCSSRDWMDPLHLPSTGLYCYSLVYRTKDGVEGTIDPKLIIKH